MSSYRIVCTEQAPRGTPHEKAHIVAVGTGTSAGKATQRWTLDEVLRAIDNGTRFYIKGEESGVVAEVEKWWCNQCRRFYIRSNADAVRDNNLDSLRVCKWSS